MNRRMINLLLGITVPIGLVMSSPCWAKAAGGNRYTQQNLVSDDNSKIPAAHQDKTLLNPWGVAFFPGSPFWINDNGSGISALYQGDGTGAGGADPAPAVTVPPASGSAPTGIVANSSLFAFQEGNGDPALFIFATEDGTISAWNLKDGAPSSASPPLAELEATGNACTAGSAVYKGLALATNVNGVFLYATNFRCGTVDVFGPGSFTQTTVTGGFQDPKIPAGFAPFGIAKIDDNLVVTYAKQNTQKHDDVAGKGNGFVDIFDTNGNLIRRFASRGKLNSPWGIVEAPFNFGTFSGDLLIGNFGDGRINAFDEDGHSEGQLKDASNKTIAIDGLWSLVNGEGLKSDPGTVYFTAGPNNEADGLFGSLTPAS